MITYDSTKFLKVRIEGVIVLYKYISSYTKHFMRYEIFSLQDLLPSKLFETFTVHLR